MKYLKIILKLLISGVIIAVVLRKIDEKLLLRWISEAHPAWLLWAGAWFVLSKVIAANRVNMLLKAEGVTISDADNLRLYWVGMYYNLLLPGGVSGDGYKIKALMDRFGKPFKRMFAVMLLDRLSGMVTLGQLCCVLLPGIPRWAGWWGLSAAGVFFGIGFSRKLYQWAGGDLLPCWGTTTLLSVGVQVSQVVSAMGLMLALGESGPWVSYALLFLLSSVAAMLPLTIGGAGARELTFLYGASFLSIDGEKAVAIAFLFYIISTLVALLGGVLSFKED